MKNLLLSFVLILGLSACQKDLVLDDANPQAEIENTSDATTDLKYPNALADFRPYFLRFEAAAKERGLSYDASLSALETGLENISEEDVVGECYWNSHAPELVNIDLPFWNSASDLDREYVMFHELGHCVLFREHDNSENDQGYCLSIMASGTTDCVSAYWEENRAYYLDELFGVDD